jgi:hypothetical protein
LAEGGANNGLAPVGLLGSVLLTGGGTNGGNGAPEGGANKGDFASGLKSLGSSGVATDKVSNIIGSGSSSKVFAEDGGAVFSLKASGKIKPGELVPKIGSAASDTFSGEGGVNKEFSKRLSPAAPFGEIGRGGNLTPLGGGAIGFGGIGLAGEKREFSKKSSTFGAFGEDAFGGGANKPPDKADGAALGIGEVAFASGTNKFSGADGKVAGGGANLGGATASLSLGTTGFGGGANKFPLKAGGTGPVSGLLARAGKGNFGSSFEIGGTIGAGITGGNGFASA